MSLDWSKANPERMREIRKKYAKSIKGKLKLKQVRRKYRNSHKVEIAERDREYRDSHKKEIAKKHKEYRQTEQGRAISKAHKKNHYFLKKTQGIGVTNP